MTRQCLFGFLFGYFGKKNTSDSGKVTRRPQCWLLIKSAMYNEYDDSTMFVWVSVWLFRQGFSIVIVVFCKVITYSVDVIYTFLFCGLNVRFNLSKTCFREYFVEMIGRKTTLWTAQGMGTLVQTSLYGRIFV